MPPFGALATAAVLVTCLHTALLVDAAARPCVRRWYGFSSAVCVCNASYCDAWTPLPELPIGRIAHYVSTRCGRRLALTTADFTPQADVQPGEALLVMNASLQFQEMLGFGGAMTDSAAFNIMSLSKASQENLLRSYYASGPGSAGHSIVRVPMGGTDFSSRFYTYDDSDRPDPHLHNFSLPTEDTDYKIPLLLRARQLRDTPLRLHAAPWTAPNWMKGGNGTDGFSYLLPRYYHVWADYFVRFLQEYSRRGLDVWAVSEQNEPTDGWLYWFGLNSMGWTPKTLRLFLEKYLGPALQRRRPLSSTLIFVGEDTREYLDWAEQVLHSKRAKKLVSGATVHWYNDRQTGPEVLDQLHQKYPSKLILYTEASDGPFMGGGLPAVRLGAWERAENYSSSIIQVANHWTSAWYDWNLALDPDGGPNWSSNAVDAPIIVNASADEFYRQPMFYAVAHFSSFVAPGSRRVELLADADADSSATGVESVAFVKPAGDLVVVLQNRMDSGRRVVLRDPLLGDVRLQLPGHSLHTLVYRPGARDS